MSTLIIAIGQFQMLFFAANQTHNIPVNTPNHSNKPVPKINCDKLSLKASAIDNIDQKYKLDFSMLLKSETKKERVHLLSVLNKKSGREQPLPENKPNKLFMKNTLITEDALNHFITNETHFYKL